MGTASRVVSVIFRIGEFISAVIVVAVLGRYLRLLDIANVGAGSRIIYAEVIGGLSIFFSLVLIPPVRYSFYAFPLDFALFICWMVAFGLLDNLAGGRACYSSWYWGYWGYYWGGFWHTVPRSAVTATLVGTVGCGEWRTVLAFSFIGGFCWLINTLTGIYYTVNRKERRAMRMAQGDVEGNMAQTPSRHKRGFFSKEKPPAVATTT